MEQANGDENDNLTDVSFSYYQTHFGTPETMEMLPETAIIKHLVSKPLQDWFWAHQAYRLSQDKPPSVLTLDECFAINDESAFRKGLQKGKLNILLERNPNYSLDELLVYNFFSGNSQYFKGKTAEETISSLKFQIGKDVSRPPPVINGKVQSFNQGENYVIANKLYEAIIEEMRKHSYKSINLDWVNKLALSTCQYIRNNAIDMITVTLFNILPEVVLKKPVHKDHVITIHSSECSIQFDSKSEILLYKPKPGAVHIEDIPYGTVHFVLNIDILRNTYSMQLSIDMDIDMDIGAASTEFSQESKDALSASLTGASLIAFPFILGALGGRRKTRRRQRGSPRRQKGKNNNRRPHKGHKTKKK